MSTSHHITSHRSYLSRCATFSLVTVFLMFALSLNAQFTSKPYAAVTMTFVKQEQWAKIDALPRVGALSYADVGAFGTWCNSIDGSVSFSIPGVTGTFVASQLQSTYVSNDDYTYIGKIAGDANSNFAISKDEEGVVGFIYMGNDRYYIYPLGGNEVVFLKDAPSSTAGLGCDAPAKDVVDEDENNPNEILTNFCSNPDDQCYALVDIMVMIHPNAFGIVPLGWRNLTQLNVNTILRNSGIINKQVRLRLVSMPSSITIPISPNALTDANKFRNDAGVNTFRNNAGADIMVLLCRNTWVDQGDIVFGSVTSNDVNTNNAFAVVNFANSLGARITFAHEIAHIWGALHARPIDGGNDDAFDCAHAHRYIGTSGLDRITALGPLGPFGERILYYSNPDVVFDGFPTGVGSLDGFVSANNAKKIKKSFCTVAGYKTPQALYAQIEGPVSLCPGDNINYKALITNGTSTGQTPASIVWTVSPAANGPFTILSTGGASNAFVSASLGTPGTTLFLTLTITTVTGSIWTSSKAIRLQTTCLQGGGSEDRTAVASPTALLDPNLYIAPNPAQDLVRLGTKQVGKVIYTVAVYNTNGALMLTSPPIQEGAAEISLDVSKFSSGLYYAKCSTNQGMQTKLFSILKN